MFKNTVKDLGILKEKVEVVLEFPYEDIYLITKITTPCDCTRVYNLTKSKIIQIKYEPKAIPPQRKGIGYEIVKNIIIEYQEKVDSVDQTIVTLTFSAKIIK